MELKQRMTFEEMELHLKETTFKIPNRVSVGKHARELGYSVYKPMIEGKIRLFYVNTSIPKK